MKFGVQFFPDVDACGEWAGGLSSKDYPGYDRMVESLRAQTMESQIASGSAWIGTPAEIRETANEVLPAFETAPLKR